MKYRRVTDWAGVGTAQRSAPNDRLVLDDNSTDRMDMSVDPQSLELCAKVIERRSGLRQSRGVAAGGGKHQADKRVFDHLSVIQSVGSWFRHSNWSMRTRPPTTAMKPVVDSVDSFARACSSPAVDQPAFSG
jgi:hypothetical protein